MTKTAEERARSFANTLRTGVAMDVEGVLTRQFREAEQRGMLRAAEIARDFLHRDMLPKAGDLRQGIAEAIIKAAEEA